MRSRPFERKDHAEKTGIRDPFLYRLRDGSWVTLATDIPVGGDFAKANSHIHVWTSPDLVNWSADRLLKVNATNPNSYSWAPAVHWDPVRAAYGITFTTVPQGKSYSVIDVTYTTDFVTATNPAVFYDAGTGVIDSHVVTDGDTYCPNAKFDLWQGDLTAGTWTKVGRQSYTAPLNAKHNTVHPITAADRDRLLAKYGGTSWNLLKSYNFPDRYLRHFNNLLYTQPVSTALDRQDATYYVE